MAEYVSGNGGYIAVAVAGSGAYVRYDVTRWVLRNTSRLTENTHSGTPASNFEYVVEHNEWNADIPLDVLNYPVDGSLVENKFDIVLHVCV
jgi:hypothetical protein